jgi:hypothetical protein
MHRCSAFFPSYTYASLLGIFGAAGWCAVASYGLRAATNNGPQTAADHTASAAVLNRCWRANGAMPTLRLRLVMTQTALQALQMMHHMSS